MNKKKLVELICQQLEKDHAVLIDAAKATYEAATHEESKPENEYDTRGLENSYLAGAQAKRAAEIEEVLSTYKYLNVKSFTADDPIASTAVVELLFNGKKVFVFLVPKGGGISVNLDGHSVQVITPSSPLGEALLDLHVGDEAIVEQGNENKIYEVLSVH